MKKLFYSKLLITMLVAMSLTACMGKQLETTEQNHNVNYGGYLIAVDSCKTKNFHEVNYVDSGGEKAQVKIAGKCDDIQKPQHGGEYVAQVQTAYVQAGGQVLSATIGAVANYEVSKDNNRTRVDIAELQNEREAAENAVLIEAIGSSDAQTEAITALTVSVTEQNATLVELVETLTDDEEEEGEEGDETEEGEEEGGEGES